MFRILRHTGYYFGISTWMDLCGVDIFTRYDCMLMCTPMIGDEIIQAFMYKSCTTAYWSSPSVHMMLTLQVPFAFIYGEEDTLITPDSCSRMVKLLDNSIKRFPVKGQFVSVESPPDDLT